MTNFCMGDDVTATRGFANGQTGTIVGIKNNVGHMPIHICSRDDDWVTVEWHSGGFTCMPANHWKASSQMTLPLKSKSYE